MPSIISPSDSDIVFYPSPYASIPYKLDMLELVIELAAAIYWYIVLENSIEG